MSIFVSISSDFKLTTPVLIVDFDLSKLLREDFCGIFSLHRGACGLGGVCYWKKVQKKEQGVEEDLKIELEIKSSSNAPHKFQLKELLSATGNFHSSNKLACCHPNPYERPSMRTVLQVLIGEAAPPFVVFEKPAFTWPAMPPVINEELNSHTPASQNEPITELINLSKKESGSIKMGKVYINSILDFVGYCYQRMCLTQVIKPQDM
ncbi:hypothetical protein VNO77_15676 [Canavalia gladiata]|uniref:Uncharacterized protein n=1 Tax=Canavalia gladiata TaxID=3824 RepID=A0AAN9M0H1_CANGL